MSDTKTKVQRNGQDTSWTAALLQTPEKSGRLYAMIRHALLRYGPLTDEELEERLVQDYDQPFTSSGIRSRRNELVLSGWVTKARDNGQVLKRPGSNGSPRIVWRAVQEGEVVEVPTTNGERVPQGTVLVQHRDHEAGMEAARRLVLWEIGDPTHADAIVRAYLNPEQAMADLDADGAPR